MGLGFGFGLGLLFSEKVAVTSLYEFIVTWQVVALPVQAPDQPPKVEPEFAVAVSVTLVPLAYDRPGGFALTDPEPVPIVVIDSSTFALKVAVTDLLVSINSVHVVAIPEQAPDQPAKFAPTLGEAVRVTTVPFAYAGLLGLRTIVPDPVPKVLVVRPAFNTWPTSPITCCEHSRAVCISG